MMQGQNHFVGLNAGEVQDVCDQNEQCFARTPNGVHQVSLIGSQICLCQKLQPSATVQGSFSA